MLSLRGVKTVFTLINIMKNKKITQCLTSLGMGLALLVVENTVVQSNAYAANDFITVYDPKDMADTSGDIRSIGARVIGSNLHLSMTVEGVAAPSTEQTPANMSNRYYYHWLLDTDNNPATGRSNAEYEGKSTGVKKAVGAERVIMIGWRDGKPGGIEVYNPLNEDVMLKTNYTYQASGNTLSAVIPLADLGLTLGQTIGLSAFQEGASDGWAVDWMESDTITLNGITPAQVWVADPQDLADSSGDIRSIGAQVLGEYLCLSMTVEKVAGPSTEQTPEGKSNRYYYHWLIDTDNNPATGRSNSEYEGTPTGVKKPIGAERVVMIGWRDGKPGGIEVYNPLNEDVMIKTNFTYQVSGNSLTAFIALADLGLTIGQTIGISAFQEGASDGWAVDWMESAPLTLTSPTVNYAVVNDPKDMGDTSGDIRNITAHVEGASLFLTMTVETVAAPATEQTPEGKSNRYYYHWLLDTDNNPATGRSNAEYEGTPTGVKKPIGAERVVMIGWRDGKPGGIEVYNPLDEDVMIKTNFTYQSRGNTLTAIIPLSEIGLTLGQTISVSAFQEGASDGWAVDWIESASLTLEPPISGRMKVDGDFQDWTAAANANLVAGVDDPQDLGDSSGDIRRIEATVESGYLYLRMIVEGTALPAIDQTPEGKVNRYYYHWLIDRDNNPATGRSNAEYEGTPTGVKKPVGSERVIMIGWRDGKVNGLEVYDPLNEDVALLNNFEYKAAGNSVEARIKLSDLGLSLGQTIALSAFQEGASDGWAVDWMESVSFTLAESSSSGMTLENLFAGNPYSFEIQVQDSATAKVDTSSIKVRLDGKEVQTASTKSGSWTTITGRNPQLLAPDSLHTVSLFLSAGNSTQTKDFVFKVDPYSVLSLSNSLKAVNEANKGFVVKITQISGTQTGAGSVHSNLVELAEKQFAGLLKDETSGMVYYNEAEPDSMNWKVTPLVEQKFINWFEFAPDMVASLNFTNDVAIPKVDPLGTGLQGLVTEITAYLKLDAGYHKLGLYTEGGHKITAGFSPNAPLLSLFDNTGDMTRVPTYYARNQFFDVVAPEAGYYPVRFLWFQDRHREEIGMMLELFSVKDRQMHLLNDVSDSKSILAYRAGVLIGQGPTVPTINVSRQGTNLVITWTGILQVAEKVTGPWIDYGDASQSPLIIPVGTPGIKFGRSRNY